MERQEQRSRMVLFLAFILTLIAVALLGAAMGSEYWVVADVTTRIEGISDSANGVSFAHHGLFGGEINRDDIVSPVRNDLTITCDAATRICRYDAVDQKSGQIIVSSGKYDSNMSLDLFCSKSTGFTGSLVRPGEISFWSWMATVAFLSLAMFFGLVAAIFTMVNVLYVPISDIVGVAGVYVWNVIAATMAIVTLCVWAGLYYTHLRYNMLAPAVFNNDITSCGLAKYGLAFWLCLVAVVLFLLNVVVIRLRRGTRSLKKSALNVKYRKGEETLY